MTTNFMGRDGFTWFTGVVEDRKDPLQVGRVRVRCLGYHTENKEELPTADLPWASVMHPVTDPSMSGMGTTPSFLVEGTWVVGFFRDTDLQEPIIMGSLPGIPSKSADPKTGFNDPNGVYPRQTSISDVSEMARGQSDAATPTLKENNRKQNITPATFDGLSVRTATGTDSTMGHITIDSFSEPSTGYAPEYPFNHVFTSESGHSLEFDDTADNTRISLFHASGTYTDIQHSGLSVSKSVDDHYDIRDKRTFEYVADQKYITVGNHLMIRANDEKQSHNCITIQVGANGHINIVTDQGDLNITVNGNVRQKVTGNMSVNVNGKYYVESDGEMEFRAPRIDFNK